MLQLCFLYVSSPKKLLAPASRGYSNMKYIMTLLLASTGFIPMVHWVSNLGIHSEEVQIFLPAIVKFYTSIGVGFIILITRLERVFIACIVKLYQTLRKSIRFNECLEKLLRLFKPERFSPGGILNVAFNSHNLWHLILLLSFIHWRKCLLIMIRYRLDHICSI